MAEGDVYGADQQRRARVCRIALGEPATPRRGAWSAGAGALLYMLSRRIVLYSMPYAVYMLLLRYICSCCMCACGATYARSSLAVWRQLTTHTRARREPAQLHRGAHHLAYSSLCTCTVLWSCCQSKLVLRARPPPPLAVAASLGLQPEITALARRGRNSFDSPLAMMHTRIGAARTSR